MNDRLMDGWMDGQKERTIDGWMDEKNYDRLRMDRTKE